MTSAVCNPTDRSALNALDVGRYQHVIVLSADNLGEQGADARTLVTLLHLRDIEESLGDPFSIVSEINDDANREIAQVTKADDFVVSENLINLLLTQLTENRHLAAGAAANFATVAAAARRRGETALGYRIHTQFHQPPTYGVMLNPPKNTPLTLTGNDRIVVVAED